MKNIWTTKNLARIAVLSAMSFVLQFLAFPILPYASFLKVDFADVPVVLAGFSISPIAGIIVALVKNLLQLPFSSTGYIGELSNFCQASTYVLVSSLIYRQFRSIKGVILAMGVAIVSVTIVGLCTNFFIMLPLYMPFLDTAARINVVLTAMLPFNLIKFSIESVAVFLLYKRVRFLLKDKPSAPPPVDDSTTELTLTPKN